MSKPSRRPGGGLRVLLAGDGATQAVRATAHVAARAGLPVAITTRMFMTLVHELGSGWAVWRFIGQLATETGRPVFCNGPRRDGRPGSSTVAIPPADPAWTQERLCGYVGGLKDEIEAMFGETDGPPDWPGRAA